MLKSVVNALLVASSLTFAQFAVAQVEPETNLDGAKVTVTVTSLKAATGDVYISVFNDPSAFPQDASRAVKTEKVKATGATATFVITGLPAGTYAFSTFHDENGNGKLDTGMFGIPKEGFGFSNNPVIRFGAPSFDQSKVVVQGNTQLTIQLNHF